MIWIEDYRSGWKVSEVICIKCGKRWIAARPEETLLKELECPECMNQGFAIETGESISYLPCDRCEHKSRVDGSCRLRIQDKNNCVYFEERKSN